MMIEFLPLVIVLCTVLSNPLNGLVEFSTRTEGSLATYDCNDGFLVEGEETRTCQKDGQWSGVEPFCRREFTTVVHIIAGSQSYV